MSTPTKHERTVCVLLPNKSQLDVTIGLKSTGQDVFNSIAELLGIKEMHFFGLTVVRDNEHIFLDMEEKLAKYFSKEWRQDSGKGTLKRQIPLLLFLKVQFYVENGRLFCERKARHFYYSDLRERVRRSECRQQEEVYFQLAGYALQADLGDCPMQREGMEVTSYFEPKDYFPPWIIAKRGVKYLLCHGPKVHQELWGMSTRDAIFSFIRDSCQLEDVPVTFYRLQKDKKEEKGTALLGLTLRGMQVYQEVNNIRQLLYDFPWSNVGRLTFLGKKFEIQPDGLPSARKLVYYTGSSFRSRHLLLHLSNSHQVYLSLQPALKHLRQVEESKEKKRYRESYISDDLDMDPPGSESSPGLSRRSTGSSGIEADARQHSISTEMTSMGEEVLQHREKCLSSATSQDSSSMSESDVGSKGRREEQQDGAIKTSVGSPEEALVERCEMSQLADLLDGVSVDFARCPAETQSPVYKRQPQHADQDTLLPIQKMSRPQIFPSRHSLHDVHLCPPSAPTGMALPSVSYHNYTSGLPDVTPGTKTSVDHSYYPYLHCQAKPSFYGHRSTNCLALDTLSDEQFLEFIL
ncbi:FERM domain-containing protein 6-like [Xiphophorus maculatus]|uniref:FERM domain-containing protein 6-like n=1 Tax=Xiphophorus maculatus TaxID=8083 RepID=UPI0006D8EC6C|nr:FERM domain-containing protein 6-like [Xiphophorus maculatus]XP_023182717.1 FERM domain-containing protein 6-like [Xiphophorus maculatus]